MHADYTCIMLCRVAAQCQECMRRGTAVSGTAISAIGWLREYIGHLRCYRRRKKIATDPELVGRSKVRERGTSGHAAAH